MLTLTLLGPARLARTDGGPVPPELLWRKHLGLLAYLVRSPRRTRSREHLVGLLWGEKSDTSARHSLREALRVLRRTLGESLVADGDLLVLDTAAVTCDVERMQDLTARAQWVEAAALVNGEFLEGFAVPDAPPFEDWLAAERVTWRGRLVDVLLRATAAHLAAGRPTDAVATAETAMRQAPDYEPAVHQGMQALMIAGQGAAALARFDALVSTLEEQDRTPTAAIAALARRLRTVQARPTGHPYRRGAVDPVSRPPLVGRAHDLTTLEHAWQAIAAGRAGLMLVEGEQGLGRTRLLEELMARVVVDYATVARARMVQADRDAPALSGLLTLVRPLHDAVGVAAARPEALATLAFQFPEWADAFPDAARRTPLPALDACRDVLLAVLDEGPLLLAVDDAHWLDGGSLAALEQLLRDAAVHPFGLVLSAAIPDAAGTVDALRRHITRDRGGASVRLRPLAESGIADLVVSMVPGLTEDQRLRIARRVAADAAGIPLLAVELLQAVALGLDLGAIPSGWPEPLRTLDQTLPGDLPPAIVAATRIAFRCLDRSAREVLCAAAVMGERLLADRLAAATGHPLSVVWDALDELERHRWLASDHQGYVFVARITREVIARDLVTPGQRKRLLDAIVKA